MNPDSETTNWSYQNNDWLSVQTDNNGNYTHYIHNALGQLTEIANYNPSASIVSEIYSITHDAAGNNLSESISIPGYTSLGGTITNTYDSLDQIATSHSTRTATGMGYSWTPAADGFEVDAAGNLTTLRDQTQTYTASNNEINKTGFVYDDNGNPTTYEGTHTLTWDPENRLTEYTGSTTLTCGWRPDGMRAWKNSSSTTTYFYYGLRGVPVLEYRSGSIYAINTFGPNGLISRGDTTATDEIYYQFDERGNTITRSDASATVLGYHGSDTYGVQFASESSTDPFLGFGAQWGYYRDSEIAFLLLGHRVYDPGYARFLNRDPIGFAGGINVYSYASNNPVNKADPTGLGPADAVLYRQGYDEYGNPIPPGQNPYVDAWMSENIASYLVSLQDAGIDPNVYQGDLDPRAGHFGLIRGVWVPARPPARTHPANCPPKAVQGSTSWQEETKELQGEGNFGGAGGWAQDQATDVLMDQLASKAEMDSTGAVVGVGATVIGGLDAGLKSLYIVGGYRYRIQDVANGYDPAIWDPNYTPYRKRP